MPQHNLRVISRNLVDETATSLTGSSSQTANTSVANLQNDTKSSIWRTGTHSNSSVKANLVLSFSSTQVGGVAIPYSNLSSSCTIRVRAYTGTAPTLGGTVDTPTVSTPGTLVYDTGVISGCPVDTYTTPNVNNWAFLTSRNVRAWFPTNVTCTSILIEILDTNTAQYVEIGKVVVGAYWSATYNTQFGLGIGMEDNTTKARLQSGDLSKVLGTRYRTMNFDMKYLSAEDRKGLRQILERNGTSIPMFVSLFPQIAQAGETPSSEEYDLEHTYSIYGVQSQMQRLINSNYTLYSNSLELEEV